MFSREATFGEPIQPWVDRIIEHPKLAMLGLALPMIGFPLMLVVGMVFYPIMPKKTWSMILALTGYIIGVPLAVLQFFSVWNLVRVINIDPQNAAQFGQITAFELNQFMFTNNIVGPFFIMVIGNTFLCYTVLKLKVLPKMVVFVGSNCGDISIHFIFFNFFFKY